MTLDLAALDIPRWFVQLVVGGYGLVLGSFLNVVIHRVPRGLSVLRPRSACPGCGRLIRWHENVPLLSWLALRGRCAGCRQPIAWRYPAVELLTALLMLLALDRFGPSTGFLIAALFLLLLLALVFIDLELMLLPDALTLPGTFAGLALSFVSPFTTPADALLGALVGLLVIESLNLAYKLLRGRDGMGAGDTKMMMMMGAFLGWQDTIVGLVLASFIGTLVAIPALAFARLRDPGRSASAGDESSTPAPDAVEDAVGVEPERTSALLDLIPQTRQELLALLTILGLASTFIVGPLDPPRALAACLVGIALLMLATRLLPRVAPLAAWLPFGGALMGAPPTRASLAIAAAALALTASAVKLLGPRLPASSDGAASVDDEPGDEPAPTLMQAAVPFGVFLGIGAGLALLAGDDLVEWYLSFAARLLGPA